MRGLRSASGSASGRVELVLEVLRQRVAHSELVVVGHHRHRHRLAKASRPLVVVELAAAHHPKRLGEQHSQLVLAHKGIGLGGDVEAE